MSGADWAVCPHPVPLPEGKGTNLCTSLECSPLPWGEVEIAPAISGEGSLPSAATIAMFEIHGSNRAWT